LVDRSRTPDRRAPACRDQRGSEPADQAYAEDDFAESAALAGSTTESLRNIELVKSLGLVEREVERLNRITGKILELELRKVKYVRRLGFIQGRWSTDYEAAFCFCCCI